MIKISPSILACDFTRLGEEVADIETAGADMVHLDVMDGKFVSNISFGLPIVEALRKKSKMVFDVHLMIDTPELYIPQFIKAGADIVTFHIEATENTTECIKKIKEYGKFAGIAIKPNTPIDEVYPYLDQLDMVLIMTVEPGYGGQELIPETLDKVKTLKAEISRRGLAVDIQVDGGINAQNSKAAIMAGANILVAGSAVFKSENRKKAIDELR